MAAKYWINSNSGDYIFDDNNVITLCLISRYDEDEGKYIPTKYIKITPAEFSALKGFVPIKYKKLFIHRNKKEYTPTDKGGAKGKSKRIDVPTKSDVRNSTITQILK